jgi:hypothetical protein
MPEQRKTFHQELDEIRDDIVRLGALVGEVIPRGTEVLLTNDMSGAQAVIEADDELDDLSLRIEEHCYHVLALQQPMASDLRSIVTGLWLTGELERSGDLMVNVAKGARRIYGVSLDPKLRGLIERMSEEASRLMKLPTPNEMRALGLRSTTSTTLSTHCTAITSKQSLSHTQLTTLVCRRRFSSPSSAVITSALAITP